MSVFAVLTTMRVGGPIGRFEVAASTEQADDLLREADRAGAKLLVIGGGSNLVVGDAGWDGTVIKMASAGLDIDGDRVTADAGLDWDQLERTVVGEGLAGVEALSGIPGTVGGTPVQNAGAYVTETSDVLAAGTVLDRTTGAVERWGRERCGFGSHRQSVFKHSDRWVVLDVTFRLEQSKQSIPVTAKDVYERLGIQSGGTAALADVRDAVIEQRRSRKKVLDADDHATWSVGSFFINPVLDEVPAAAAECPSKPDAAGTKLHAAWLIQHTGFTPGNGTEFGNGTVSLSSKHTLAVTNRGGATTADVMAFAAHIRDGVAERYEIRLNPECDLINCSYRGADSTRIAAHR